MISSGMKKWVETPFAFIAVLICYCLGLWAYSVQLTGDQKVYLSVAMEMRERGEWIIPYLFEAPNFLKPPLQYWATLIGWNIFGFNTFGALFPSVLALLLSAYFTKKIYEFFFGKNGNLAAILFASSLGTLTYGTTAQMEIWVVLFYLMAWYYWVTLRECVALIIVGALAWIKGPLYSVLWVMSVVLEQVIQKEFRRLLAPKFFLSLILGAVVGLSWYALASRTHFNEIISVFFKQENVSKLGGNQSSPFSLWGEFFYTLFPWVLILIPAFIASFKHENTALFQNFKKFMIGYALIPAIFFTAFPYRVNTYLYFLTPLFAMFLSHQYEQGIPSNNTVSKMFIKPVSVLLGAALIFVIYRLKQGEWISVSLFIALSVVVLLWVRAHVQFNLYSVALTSLLLVSLIRVGGVQVGEYDLRNLREQIEEKKLQNLGYWIEYKNIWHEIGMISAAVQQPIKRLYTQQEVLHFVQHEGGAIILNDEQGVMAQAMRCSEWRRFRRHLRFPIIDFLRNGVRIDQPDLIATHYICTAQQ